MDKEKLSALMVGMAMIIALWIVSERLPIVLIFIPGVLVTFVVYRLSFYKKTPEPERILPLYLLALAVQFLHFTEEYLTGFTERIPVLLNQSSYSKDYWVGFNMVAYALFILGAIVLFRKIKFLMMIPLFFIVVGVVLNTIGHILIAIYVGGYFPGLYTALVYLMIGPLMIKRLSETNGRFS